MFPALVSLDLITVQGEPLFLGTVVDITARKQAEDALRQAHATLEQRVQERTADLQRLTGELAVAESRERKRLGELLHDGLQQYLVAARLRVDLLQRAAPSEDHRELHTLLAEAIAASRSLTAELSPPILSTDGFLPALRWLATWKQNTHHLTVQVTADPSAELARDATKILFFRSVRELLFNVVKHAGV